MSHTVHVSEKQASDELLLKAVWGIPDLSYCLHDGQLLLRDIVKTSPVRKNVILCARRWGKSYLACNLAIETALAVPGSRILLAAPTQKDAESIMVVHIDELLKDCPEDLKPTFKAAKLQYQFRNGSLIQLAGTDGKNRERLRGRFAHLAILDEAGFMDDLDYVVESVVMPQLMTTGGKLVLSSTPSRSPEHPFVSKYCLEAEETGNLKIFTVYDAPHLSPEIIEEFKKEAGGATTTNWRREYLCERIVEEARAVVPEFSQHRENLIQVLPVPKHFNAYTIADFGFADLTVIGFWEHHFEKDLLYCRAELVFRNTPTQTIAPAVEDMEKKLWGRPANFRYGDPNFSGNTSSGLESRIVLRDFVELHGQVWLPCNRDKVHAAVNELRAACMKQIIAWHPHCSTTIAHLGGGIWNKARTSFERSGSMGHYDGIAMSMYAQRHVNRSLNPIPYVPEGATDNTHFIRKDLQDIKEIPRDAVHALERSMNRRKQNR